MSFEFPIFEKILKMNERQLKDYMVNFLTENYRRVENNKHFVLAYGNIPIALCAHLDTVYGDTPNFVFHDEKHGVIWSPQGLGADDRAGIYAIIRLIEDGFRPHIILTTEEETGCNGALELVLEAYRTSPFDNLKYIIELDRQGFNDCVFYECGNEKFHDYIQQFGFKEQKGSFSDISFICPMWKVCGVNLSIGYYYEHSPAEFLVEGMFEDILASVKIMLSEKNIPHFDWILIPADEPTMEGFEF